MMIKSQLALALIASGFAASSFAAPVIMEGNFVRTAVSDNGTLGYGGTTSPGIVHDATGSGAWSVDDYLTPGTPFEGFYVNSAETGLDGNNNASRHFAGSGISTSSITDTSGVSGYNQSVKWTGHLGSFYAIETDTYFNDGDERISMLTKITALSDLTGVEFLRVLDPDPDVRSFGSYKTVNGRGNVDKGLAAEDWVHAEGTKTGLTVGLFSDSDVEHNTGVSRAWSKDPSTYLNGLDDGDGDYTVGLAFDLGDLQKGDSLSLAYHYVFGDSLDSVDIPVETPEPAILALFGLGLAGLGASRRKAKK